MLRMKSTSRVEYLCILITVGELVVGYICFQQFTVATRNSVHPTSMLFAKITTLFVVTWFMKFLLYPQNLMHLLTSFTKFVCEMLAFLPSSFTKFQLYSRNFNLIHEKSPLSTSIFMKLNLFCLWLYSQNWNLILVIKTYRKTFFLDFFLFVSPLVVVHSFVKKT